MEPTVEKKSPSFFKRMSRSIGPGFITGAADDDPSGIATYSQVGASFGFSQLWVVLFSYPFMTVIQEMCGRIGLVTGKGLAALIKEHYSRTLLFFSVSLLLIANTINIGADLGAMAESLQLVIPLPFSVLLIMITGIILGLEIFVSYKSYVKFLKYLTLTLLAYVGTALLVVNDWSAVLYAIAVPHIVWRQDYIYMIAALLGTTISPYLFFWQTSEEVEEEIVAGKMQNMGDTVSEIRTEDITQMRVDTIFGMLFSQLVALFVMISAAATLWVSGLHSIYTAKDAAVALEPIAGHFASLLFSMGVVGTGLLAVPVLAGSAGYAVAEAFGWKEGLEKKFSQARGFYGVIAAATLVGFAVNFFDIGAMRMLYYAAMFNGVLAPPLLMVVILVGNNKKILGAHTNSWFSNSAGCIITLIMSAVAGGLIFSFF